MKKLSVFNFLSLDGYYKGPGNDISWHVHSDQESEFSKEGIAANNILLFGRVTYELMASYWPTPEARTASSEIADGMNSAEKIVFSKTLDSAAWNNTTLIKDDLVTAVKNLKSASSKDMTILGSGSIVSQLAENNLIDVFQFMVDPVALGAGTSIFEGIRAPISLHLLETRTFKSGVVLLTYEPMPVNADGN